MSYRFALIGCGNIAPRHADQIRLAGNLSAVCDNQSHKANLFSEQYGGTVYDDAYQMLVKESPDITVICSPNGLHAVHAIMALEKGSHVLCEKPMAITTTEAYRMLDAVKSCGKRLFVVKQNRYNPPVSVVKELLDEGRLGRINGFQINCFWNRPAAYYSNSDWRGTLSMDGGTLFTQFSHFIDLLYWTLGEIREVTGYRSNSMHRSIIEFEDNGVASLIMKNGAIGSIHYTINATKENFEGSFTLFGEKGTVKIGGQYLNTLEYFRVQNEEVPQLDTSPKSNSYGTYKGSMSNHHVVYREMLRALNDPEHEVPEGYEGLKCVEMIETIYAASPLIETLQAR